ncbi:MAG: ribosomal L7Ae/L30e/S12e/Gadd45 family protein [Nitrososphaerota archaeon]
MDLKQSLEVVSRTGRYIVGYRKSLEACLSKRATLLIVSERTAEAVKSAVKSAAAVAGARLMITPLSPSEIGVALRKNFPVATLAIIDPGSADLGQMEAEEQSE